MSPYMASPFPSTSSPLLSLNCLTVQNPNYVNMSYSNNLITGDTQYVTV